MTSGCRAPKKKISKADSWREAKMQGPSGTFSRPSSRHETPQKARRHPSTGDIHRRLRAHKMARREKSEKGRTARNAAAETSTKARLNAAERSKTPAPARPGLPEPGGPPASEEPPSGRRASAPPSQARPLRHGSGAARQLGRAETRQPKQGEHVLEGLSEARPAKSRVAGPSGGAEMAALHSNRNPRPPRDRRVRAPRGRGGDESPR